ncbi:MAG: TonB-dependent receptor, partial [Pseudomonadota bacterium]
QDIGYVEQRIVAGGLIQLGGGGFQDQLTLGVFAQADFELTDTLTINVGGRYNYEEKDVELANIATNGGVGATACSVFLDECSIDFVDGDSWSRFTPKVGLTWAPTETVNVYAHWQQAIRSGGYNLRNTVQPATIAGSDLDLGPGPFDEEIVNAFEIGAKTQPIDGAILNVAAYYNDINNAQRETNFPEAGSLIAQVITNSADITLWGVEVDGQYAVTDNLLLTGFFGYVNGDYDNIFFDISFPVNSTPAASMFPGEINELDFALEVPRLSPFTYGGGFIYSQELGDFGSANFRFNYAFRDQNFFTDNNLGPLNAVDNVDSTLSFTESSGRATLSLYGRNLLNQVNFGGATPVGTGGTFAPLTRGRQVGIELTVNFN